MATSEQVYRLHLGCGPNTPDGWINLDGAWSAWLAKYQIVCRMLKGLHILPASLRDMIPDVIIHDVRKPLPFQNNSIHAIYMYFEQADFVDVHQSDFRQSLIEGIEEVEESERVLDGAGVCIEGIKPE